MSRFTFQHLPTWTFTKTIRESSSYNGDVFTMYTKKLHRDFKRYVKETDGFEDGFELLKPLDLALTPSGNIVKRNSLYTKKETIRGRYQKQHEVKEENKIEQVNETVGVQREFNFITPEQMVDYVSKLDLSKQFLVTVVDEYDKTTHYTLNEKTYSRLSAILNPAVEQEGTTSDAEIIVLLKSYKYFKVKQIDPSKKHQGGFFKYTLKAPLEDVSKYGLFTELNHKNYEDSCFIEALKHSGQVSYDLLYKIKLSIKCRFLPMCKIKTICEAHNLHIKIEGVDTTRKTIEYGDKKLPVIRIGLIDQHYFIIDKTQYTSYSIKNYETLKDKPKWNEFIKKKERSSKRFISSLDLFRLLTKDEQVKETFLQPIELGQALYKTQFFEQFSEIGELSIGEGDYRTTMSSCDLNVRFEVKKQWQANTTRIYFDFETDVYTGGRHIPYLGFYATEEGETFGFYGESCAKQMLEHLHKKFYNGQTELLMIAHNAGYDWTTGIGQHLYKVKTIEKGSSLMFASGSYYRFGKELKITVHDSYAKIPVGLSKFGSMFALEQKKEVMPYQVYNTHNIKRGSAPMRECLSHLPKAEHSQFKTNCEKWECIRPDNTVDIIKYSARYCEMDCIVLRKGYQAFEKMIRDITALEVDHFISIASLADSYLIKEGCYEDIYDLGGVCRQFVQKCLVGGRTMLCQNTQQRESNCQMDDFDAVSLYPSAMARLPGYLKGAPKLITTTDYNELKAVSSGFYVRAKVLKVGIKRDFPLLSKINEKGIREFTNDLQGEVVYIDNVSMEDAMNFQQCEFEIIDGYMFDQGFNPKIKESIQHLFNSRLEAKKQKNPVQGIIKLIMNSCYGKCALKEIADDTVYIQDAKFEQYISRHYNWVKESTVSHDGKSHRVTKVKAINEHYNRVHIGIQVLSMSKRIMNEVMCLSQDIGQKIYYQDTDSMHIMRQHVAPLAEAFKQKYGRELIGSKQLGQFHGDFDMDNCSNVYSENFIALGKKSYIDCIVGTCNKTGELKRDVHIRMKGVPNSAILGECKKRKCSPLQIYEKLKTGEAVEFDLLKGEHGESRVRFKKTKSSTMTTVQKFTRQVQFIK